MGGRRSGMGSALASALLLTAALALTGCVEHPDTGTSDPASHAPAPEESSGGGPVAVVTIAAVDVDGLNLTVAGFVTDIDESGGACQFTATSVVSGATVTADTVGEANFTSSTCGSLQIPVSQLSKGPWDIVLHYSSDTITLESTAQRVEVP